MDPFGELADFLDGKPCTLEALDNLERGEVDVREAAVSGLGPFEEGEKAFLVIITERRRRDARHFGNLLDGILDISSHFLKMLLTLELSLMLHSIRKRSKVWNSTTGGTKMNKKMMKRALTLAAFGLLMAGGMMNASAMDRAPVAASKAPAETIDASKLSNAWDKTFPKDARVSHKKVTFHNRYGITLVGDLYTPKDMKPGEKLDAIAVAGPYGAVKEQVSGRYAQELAARGFLTLAFDPSYTGESGGQPRNTTSPDIDTEDFLAAVDYLSNRPDVDPQKIGVLGICGWGGFAINAASMDPRIKATVTSTMYDMSRVIANGYFDYDKTPEQIKAERKALREMVSAQRTLDYKNGTYKMAGGVPETVTPDMPEFVRNYHDFYQPISV